MKGFSKRVYHDLSEKIWNRGVLVFDGMRISEKRFKNTQFTEKCKCCFNFNNQKRKACGLFLRDTAA